MATTTGTVKQFYPNNGKPRLVLDNGISASAFKESQCAGVAVGMQVSFAYNTKNVNGKDYNNIDGQVAIVAGSAPAAAPAAQGGTQQKASGGRFGPQVGAAINQAIAAMPVLGMEPSMDNIEHLAQQFLLISDRLEQYKGA